MKSPTPTAEPTAPKGGGLLISLAVHAALLCLTLLVVVSRYLQPEDEPVFVSSPRLLLPAQIREHRMNAARHDASAPRPSYSPRITGASPSPISIPPTPEVNVQQMLPLNPSQMVSDQISSLIGSAGYGSGNGEGLSGGSGSGPAAAGVSFFSINDATRSIVILIDVSQSMFSRTGDYDSGSRRLLRSGKDQAFHTIRTEALQLISSLGPDTRFGIIRWSGSARSWQPSLVRATDAHKAAARDHILNVVDAESAPPTGGRPGGTRHDYALEELFRLAPESAFMLTDGNATRSSPRGGMSPIPNSEIFDLITSASHSLPALPRIHTIYYVTGSDRKEEEDLLRGIARRTKGKFRKVPAAPAPNPR
jgi:hypothetical protein